MQEQSFVEKRAFPRFSVSISVIYSDPASHKVVSTQTHDISAQGLGLIIDKELEPGICLDLSIEMPDNGEKIKRKAKVVWINMLGSNTKRVGIKLEEPELKPIPLVLRIINYQQKH